MFLFVANMPFNSPSKELKTQSNIFNIYTALLIIKNNEKLDLDQLLKNIEEDKSLSQQLGRFIEKSWRKVFLNDLSFFKDDHLIDAWGNPLCVAWRSDISLKASINLLNSVDYNLLIWSSGKNGINEFGYNDDVVYTMSDVMKDSNKTDW